MACGRNKRRLNSPSGKIGVAEQSYVRHENSGGDVDSIQRVNVITTVRLRHIAIRIGDIPLPLGIAWIVAWRCFGIHAKLSHETGANVVEVEVASDAELLQLDFVGAKQLARSAYGVVDGFIEVVVVGNIGPNFGSEEF